jgi:hypothetical protein
MKASFLSPAQIYRSEERRNVTPVTPAKKPREEVKQLAVLSVSIATPALIAPLISLQRHSINPSS